MAGSNAVIRNIIGLFAGATVILAEAFVFSAPVVHAAECGRASWYGPESGSRTANGEHFDGASLTAAHRSLKFGTKLRVTFQGKSVVVRINDRGPARRTGRVLDLSKAAAARLGMMRQGVGEVCWTVVR